MGDNNISDCARCGEDACLISFDGQHMVRVRRTSKCREYRPPRIGTFDKGHTCRTEIYDNAAEAVNAWNERHGRQPNDVKSLAGASC